MGGSLVLNVGRGPGIVARRSQWPAPVPDRANASRAAKICQKRPAEATGENGVFGRILGERGGKRVDYPPGGPSQRDWGSALGSARSLRSARGTVLRWRLAICTVQTVTILTLGAPTMRLASAARRLSTPAISTWLRSSGALTGAPFTSRTKASWMKASWSRTLSAAAGEPAVRRLEI